jgi:hypothetical protein
MRALCEAVFQKTVHHSEESRAVSLGQTLIRSGQHSVARIANGNSGLVYNGTSHHRRSAFAGRNTAANVNPVAAIHGQVSKR